MRRKQLFELHDYGWFPALWRDMITDVLSEFEEDTRIYAPVAGLLAPLAEREDEFAIVDLCSGGGHPIVIVLNAMDQDIAARTRVTLTDLFPNIPAFEAVSRQSGGRSSTPRSRSTRLRCPRTSKVSARSSPLFTTSTGTQRWRSSGTPSKKARG